MRRLILMFSLLVLLSLACSLQFQTMPQAEGTQISPTPATEAGAPGNTQDLEGPDINYNGIRFTLDPALGSRLYVYHDELAIDGKTAHSVRFSLAPEEYCQTWCVIVYPVAEYQQAFGDFFFPPAGYRGGAAVLFHAQERLLSFQNGVGTRALETFGQNYYGVSNEALKYVFRGYSEGKQYAVYVQVPARTASLPEAEPTLGPDIQQYYQQTIQSVNALAPADFTPNLNLLDALVASMQILPTQTSSALPSESTLSATPPPLPAFTPTAVLPPGFSASPTSTFTPAVEMPSDFSPILYGKKYDGNTFFFLLGGRRGDTWLPPDQAFGYFASLQGWEYDVYTLTKGKFKVYGYSPQFSPAHKIYTVGTDLTVDELGMVGVAHGWPVLQREAQELSSDGELYRQAVRDWLTAQGIAVPELVALHVFRVDIEGDGVDEIFMNATRLESQHTVTTGDYSLILMRKVQGNDAVTVPIVADVYHSQEMTLPPAYSLGNFLDLNQDGILEVVVDIRRWDGDGALIYQVDGQKITQVP